MPAFRQSPCLFAAVAWAAAAISASAADPTSWPQFRGPDGQGHAAAAEGLPASWTENENIVWKCPLPGRGWSSPVMAGFHIWLTAAVETPLTAVEKELRLAELKTTNTQPLSLSGRLSLRALCVHRQSGQILHNVELLVESRPQPTHSTNTFASPTPVLEEGKLYCHFGAYGTACLDTATRKVVWTNRDFVVNHENGPGSSPVVFGDLVIFHCDGSDQQFIAALNKRTGKVAWKTARSGQTHTDPQLKKCYGTPLVVVVNGQPQLVSPAADWLYAYDPASGRELWKLPYETLGFSIGPRPVVGDGLLYMCTSFMQSQVLAIELGGQPKVAWRFGKQAPQVPSPLLVGQELYLLGDKGIVTCLDAKTGEVRWTERLPGNYYASPLFADGRIYFFSREGRSTAIAPGPTYRQLGVGQLEGSICASPAAVGQALYIRTDQALYRVEYLKQ